MQSILEEGRELSVNELIIQALDLLKPETTIGELIELIRNDDIDLAEMINNQK